jgi:hypothetical protein
MLQAMCDCDMFFGIHALVNWEEWLMEYNSKCQVYIVIFNQDIFCKNQIITIKGVQIQPYLLGDVTYPLWRYLLKGYKPQNNDMVDQI